MKLHRLLFATFFAVAPTLQAAVLVEIKAADGVTSIYRDGPQIRMEMADNPGYMIVNTDKQSMHIIMPEERRVMDMHPTGGVCLQGSVCLRVIQHDGCVVRRQVVDRRGLEKQVMELRVADIVCFLHAEKRNQRLIHMRRVEKLHDLARVVGCLCFVHDCHAGSR